MGTPAGLLLSTVVFAAVSSRLSEPAFLVWGWRIPFLLSIVLVAIGLFIRLRVMESPSFERLKDTRGESRTPLLDVFREHPREVLVGMGIRFAQNLVFYIYTVFILSYGEKTLGYPRSVMLRGVMIVSFIGIFATPFWSYLSDRVGRRPILLGGVTFLLVFSYPFFWLFDRGPAFVPIAMILAMNIGHDMAVGVGQRLREIAQDLHGIVERHGSRLDSGAQRIARYERHGVEREAIAGEPRVEDRYDVGFLQCRCQSNLAGEALGAQADGALGRENLDDDIAVERGIVGEKYARHPTAGQLTVERVAAA